MGNTQINEVLDLLYSLAIGDFCHFCTVSDAFLQWGPVRSLGNTEINEVDRIDNRIVIVGLIVYIPSCSRARDRGYKLFSSKMFAGVGKI